MKKSIILVFSLIAVTALWAGFSISGLSSFSVEKEIDLTPIVYKKGNNYRDQWKKIDSLTAVNLPKSALEIVFEIEQQARRENNHEQIVKCLIHKIKFSAYIEENAFINAILEAEKKTKKATYPLSPVLHSLTAELYWRYYQKNRWKIYNRTQVSGAEVKDIDQWDINKIIDAALKHYLSSVENADSLRRTPITTFEEVIGFPLSDDHTLVTLYDFLAHRALSFFTGDEPNITKPADAFVLNDSTYFLPFNTFKDVTFTTTETDSLSLKFYAVQIYQELIRQHSIDPDPNSLVVHELNRLKFVHDNIKLPNKDNHYLRALRSLQSKYASYSVSTEIVYEIAYQLYQNNDPYYTYERNGKDNNTLIEAYQICTKAIKDHPKSVGANNCQSLLYSLEEKTIEVVLEEINARGKPFKGLLNHRNMDYVHMKIVEIDVDSYLELMRKNDDFIENLNSRMALKTWTLDVKNEGDYLAHAVEFKMDSLPFGHYVLLAGSSSDFLTEKEAVAYTPFWVSNLSYLYRNIPEKGGQVVVFDRESGVRLPGVKAQAYQYQYSRSTNTYEIKNSKTYTSDADGSFYVNRGEDFRSYYLKFDYKDDHLDTRNSHYSGRYRDPVKRIKTMLFTDRMIYRPGQTVHFKGIVLETDNETNEIKTNYKVNVIFKDVNYQKVGEQTLTTNEFGSFSGMFVAPAEGLNGYMTIQCEGGRHGISVEEYKRPKFEVNFEPVKEAYRLGEKVTVEGNAMMFSGAPVDEAVVSYRVVRNASFPRWCYYRGYYPNSSRMEITNGTVQTDQTGMFTVDFNAIADQAIDTELSPTYTYTVYADVTDINGETHSATTAVLVGYQALMLNVDMQEELNKKNNSFQITSRNLNGEYESASGTIKIWSLQAPSRYFRNRLWRDPDQHLMDKTTFYNNFPTDQYANEKNYYSWNKDREVYAQSFNTEQQKELILKNFSDWNSGYYVMEATTEDRFGQEVKDIRYFYLYGEDDKEASTIDMLKVIPIKNTCEPGEEAKFLIATTCKEAYVQYEIEHDKQIVFSQLITLDQQQQLITFPVSEEHRGGVVLHVTMIKNSREFTYHQTITVPYTNKQLDIQFETFRNKLLPGQQETWKLTIKDKKGDKIAAEMMASLYDASLDEFRKNSWHMNLFNNYRSVLDWSTNSCFSTSYSRLVENDWNSYSYTITRNYPELNWFGYNYFGNYYRRNQIRSAPQQQRERNEVSEEAMVVVEDETIELGAFGNLATSLESETSYNISMLDSAEPLADKISAAIELKKEEDNSVTDLTAVQARKNFNETAFFYPHLMTNENGEVVIEFTIPEALTKWKFLGLAHTPDLKSGTIVEEAVTQKDLMVYPNLPRFFREGDQLTLSTKIVSMSEQELAGKARINFYDALTNKPIDNALLTSTQTIDYSVEAKKSTVVSWTVRIPQGVDAITCKVVAKAGNFTDGEEKVVPVLSNRMLVTESLPLSVRSNQTKTFKLDKLLTNNSSSLMHHKLTLEFTSNPAWYAIQALPYLMEYPHECAEQTFSRFYANTIASHIANSSPKIKAVFDSWKEGDADAFLSNLEKNEELKAVILKETPWVLDAKDESEHKRRVGLLFDLNKMAKEQKKALNKLKKAQLNSGAWPWFSGMHENRYITQHIVSGMGHLDHLGVRDIKDDKQVWEMVRKAVYYLDQQIRIDYEKLKKHNTNLKLHHISSSQIQYLYARSFFLSAFEINSNNKEAYDYYLEQAKTFWTTENNYMQGMIALVVHRQLDDNSRSNVALQIIKSLKERALEHEEMGTYWKETGLGYYWYDSSIETQALLIEAFEEIDKNVAYVDGMRTWLLKQKQTQNWKTTRATTEACYALLLRGTNWLTTENAIDITVGTIKVNAATRSDIKTEAGTGYFKTSWNKGEIEQDMGKVTVVKKDEGVSWGALYWQYFEDLDKITPHATPLKLEKKLFVQKNTNSGPVLEEFNEGNPLRVGDKIIIRIVLKVDRDMEYVHMKDMRASGMEPINVFSGYRYQGGLGYYETTSDASTNFFFDYLRKGTYVFEYPLRANIVGDYSNGITSIQCMYAPEFTSHSQGNRVVIK